MRLFMAAYALTAFQNHNNRFGIYTYASDFQLGDWIIKDSRPVAYFSIKLNKSQADYTTMKK